MVTLPIETTRFCKRNWPCARPRHKREEPSREGVRTVMKWLTLFLLNAASAISYLAATLLIKLRLRGEPDPWRRTVGTGLRSEASKFGLSAFEVQMRSPLTGEGFSDDEQHFTRRFAAFLQAEPSARFASGTIVSVVIASPTDARMWLWRSSRLGENSVPSCQCLMIAIQSC